MKFDKRLLLAMLCVAIGAFAINASAATAAVWKHGGSNLAKHTEIGLTGGEVFETATGGMSCEVFATITTSGGSTGTIKKWEVKNCGGAFGTLAGCQVLATEAKSLPWTLDVNASDLSVTSMRIRRTFKNGCSITELDKTVTMTMTPDVPAAITEFEFHGSTSGYTSFGSLTVNSPNSGTYGIG
ncbi:MAG TPA: hypothetical protein VFY48_01610 [Solirubrobacterales bacterium]|nr:hypothetical protein [Solirubrobacterales bacterium]